jgi:DNA-binding GntR family transcriptional regulator
MAAATEQTVARLRRFILEGDLEPGARLQEVELAAQLGVSRTPVREALRELASQGLVEILPHRGARVTRWSAKDLTEIYELRSMLESHAAERAATRMSGEEVEDLVALCEKMEICARHGRKHDLVQLSDFNGEFHSRILEAADSSRLATMIASVVQIPLVIRTFTRYSPEALARSMSHHRELAAAIGANSPEWAGTVMRSHIIAARTALLKADGAADSEGEADVPPAP